MKKPAAPRSKKARPAAVRARAAKTAAATKTASPVIAAPAPAAAAAAPAKKKVGPVQFFNEVRAEAKKISWTSRKETWITSVMVAIMVAMTAVFFFVVDLGLSAAITGVLRLANPAR